MDRRQRQLSTPLLALVVFAAFAGGGCGSSTSSQPPVIESVTASGNAGNFTLTINGIGFGNPGQNVSIPYLGDLPNFRITDLAQTAQGEWGYTGDTKPLGYLSWLDTRIVVSNFGANPGDAIIITEWNDSGQGAVWGGTVLPVTTPTIAAVQFAGSGQNLQMTVQGSGFGTAPVAMPYTGDLPQFFFQDDRTPCSGSSLFTAGWTYWGALPASAVTLQFESWSDTEIQISGFAGQYGSGCATVAPGDPVAIGVFNSAAAGPNGAQTAWGGVVPTTLAAP